MSYQVGVDLGTTYSAAAVCRPGGPVELVPLGQRAHSVPSTVYAGPDGAFLIGEAAERRALSDPGRVVREFKRRIGDPTPVLVGREPVAPEELAVRFLNRVLQDVAAREGAVADRVAVTHPASWGPHKLGSLRGAMAAHGLGSAVLLSEPQAAAVGYADTERVEPGATVAVYDLGGGTFDAAVVRKTAAGGFELLGTPEGIEQLGGVDFDEAVFSHVRAALGADWAALDPSDPDVLGAVAGLRRECTAAKEALSHDTEVLIPVLLPGVVTQVRLGRAEFEEMIRPAVAETVSALRRALDSAGVSAADLSTLLLVGGSSRIPLITQEVAAEFGRSAAVDVDPKGVIAAGAAVVARAAARGPAGTAARSGEEPRPGAVVAREVARGPAGPAARRNEGAGPAAAALPPVPLAAAGASPPRGEAVPSQPEGAAVLPGSGLPPVPAGSTERSADVGPVRPAPRPPKQARPFTTAVAEPDNRRRVRIGVAAGALVLVLLGGAAAFGATRIGANQEAGASTPPVATTAVSPVATAGPPVEPSPTSVAVEPAEPVPPARPRARPPAPRSTTAPPPPALTTEVTEPPVNGADPDLVAPDNAGGQQNDGQPDNDQNNGDNGNQDNANEDNGNQNDGDQNNGDQNNEENGDQGNGAQNTGAQNTGTGDSAAGLARLSGAEESAAVDAAPGDTAPSTVGIRSPNA